MAAIYAALGDNEKTYAELDKAFKARDWELHRLEADSYFVELRNDPQFKEFVKRLNLPEYKL
jgi:hypothetical protein